MTPLFLTKNNTFIIGQVASLMGYVMNGIFWVLNKVGLPNIGLSIIIMTVIVNLCMLPLTIRQQKFSKLQAKMQPELNRIQKKYQNKKDEASMTAQQQEMQAVYAKYGVNPAGSCVQLLIQMPILLGLYRVFYSVPAYLPMVKQAFFPLVDDLIAQEGSAEFLQTLSGASMFTRQFTNDNFVNGVTTYVQNTYIDVLNKCSTADWAALTEKFSGLTAEITSTLNKLGIYNNFLGLNIANSPRYMLTTAWADKAILGVIAAVMVPALAAFTQWFNIKMMPTPASSGSNDSTAQSMKTMNMMMPLMSAFFCFTLPAGMGIYWIASAVVRAIIQIFVNKHIDSMNIDAMIEENENKAKEKAKKSGKSTGAASDMSSISSMSTKRIDSGSKYSTKVSASREKEVEAKRAARKGKKYKSGSLSARANMVTDFKNSDQS